MNPLERMAYVLVLISLTCWGIAQDRWMKSHNAESLVLERVSMEFGTTLSDLTTKIMLIEKSQLESSKLAVEAGRKVMEMVEHQRLISLKEGVDE